MKILKSILISTYITLTTLITMQAMHDFPNEFKPKPIKYDSIIRERQARVDYTKSPKGSYEYYSSAVIQIDPWLELFTFFDTNAKKEYYWDLHDQPVAEVQKFINYIKTHVVTYDGKTYDTRLLFGKKKREKYIPQNNSLNASHDSFFLQR